MESRSQAHRCLCGRWTQERACMSCQDEVEPAAGGGEDTTDNAPLDAVLRRQAKRYGGSRVL